MRPKAKCAIDSESTRDWNLSLGAIVFIRTLIDRFDQARSVKKSGVWLVYLLKRHKEAALITGFKKKNIWLRPRPHVSRYFLIRNFFFLDTKIYPRPHSMWSQRIQIEFARPHVFGFTPDSLRIDQIVPPGTGSSRSNPESPRTALLSCSSKLFLPAVLCVGQRKELADVKPTSGITYFSI